MHYQLFPALEPATEAALRASIQRFGVLVPVTVDQHGNVLDGHHRKRIAEELGVECDIRVRRVRNEDEANEIARTLNMDRRHLSAEDRRRMVEALRSEGHSYRAIAGALGVDPKTVRNDVSGGDYSPPATVRGADGKHYPARREPKPPVADIAVQLAAAEPDRDDDDLEAEAEAIADCPNPTQGINDSIESRRIPTRKEHPAVFSDAILETVASHIIEQGTNGTVLDPFAGTGRIHELKDLADADRTIGIEIEAEWAAKHPDTIHGNALEASEIIPLESVDAIATSPTYGNRMADHHDAKDDSTRLTYKHSLGRDLDEDNSGQLQWGHQYRTFHRGAWAEAVAVLKPGGTFTVNCKNHIRGGEEQRVVEWHIDTLMHDFGLRLVALDVVPTKGLMAGANGTTRTSYEIVATFRKPA